MVGSWLGFVVLGVMAVEALALWRWRPALFATFWPTIASGGAIVLALAAALEGAGLPVVGGLLALGGAAHGIDLWRRMRG